MLCWDKAEFLSVASDAGVRVHAIKGPRRLVETIQSRIIAMAFSIAAEIERDLISARTTEALMAGNAAGLPLGRPKRPVKSKFDPYCAKIDFLLANGSTQKFIAKRYSTTPANLSNWFRKKGFRKPKAKNSYGGISAYVGLWPYMTTDSGGKISEINLVFDFPNPANRILSSVSAAC
ncbi:MAG: hypothetical protein OXI87_03840 [Albidovulum sp.]|nr:hypothetical protein [Albidovulum sp.]